MTEQQIKRTANMFSGYAQEPVIVEEIKGAIYAFGSELGARRIFGQYNKVQGAKIVGCVEYSKPMESWYFCLEPKF
jgi:hypothetical protein